MIVIMLSGPRMCMTIARRFYCCKFYLKKNSRYHFRVTRLKTYVSDFDLRLAFNNWANIFKQCHASVNDLVY